MQSGFDNTDIERNGRAPNRHQVREHALAISRELAQSTGARREPSTARSGMEGGLWAAVPRISRICRRGPEVSSTSL